MLTLIPWRENPEYAFELWLHETFRHTRGAMWRALAAWSALARLTALHGRHVVETTAGDLDEFLGTVVPECVERERKARQRRLLEVLSLAFDAIRAAGFRDDNPARPLLARFPPNARPLPIVLAAPQRAALSRTLSRWSPDWQNGRDRAIAMLVLLDGLRPAQVASMKLSDLAVEGVGPIALAVCPESGRFKRASREALLVWLAQRSRAGIAGALAFPATAAGTAFAPSEVYRIVRRLLRRAGVDAHHLGRLDIRDCLRQRLRDPIRKTPRVVREEAAAPANHR
jgi:integrase